MRTPMQTQTPTQTLTQLQVEVRTRTPVRGRPRARRRGLRLAGLAVVLPLVLAGCVTGEIEGEPRGVTPETAGPGQAPRGTPSSTASPDPDASIAADVHLVGPLIGSGGAEAIVDRDGWRVVASSRGCVLSTLERPSASGAADDLAASHHHLDSARTADAGHAESAVGAVDLAAGELDGERVWVAALVQDWTVAGADDPVAVRVAARGGSHATYDADTREDAVVVALDCLGAVDEAVWGEVVDQLRVGWLGELGAPGVWP